MRTALRVAARACRHYNELYHEHHPAQKLCTLAGQFEGKELELLQPFLNLMDLQRGEDASLLRHDGQVIRNRDGFRMYGFVQINPHILNPSCGQILNNGVVVQG